VITELAWHNLFIRTLLSARSRCAEGLRARIYDHRPAELQGRSRAHGCRTETVIAVDLTEKIDPDRRHAYAGEMKKSVFTSSTICCRPRACMPMHCSANVGPDGDTAMFFGLSGTGKTTLSADPERTLIGDDEHGWSEDGIFNFEGGCYAKTIKLSAEAEPQIFATTKRFGTVLENVVLDERARTGFRRWQARREHPVAYPIDFIPNTSSRNRPARHPKNVIMLTADAFGVLPPIAKLTPDQAMYHFLSGYTAKVAGTEKGVTEPRRPSRPASARLHAAPSLGLRQSAAELIAKHTASIAGWSTPAGPAARRPIRASSACRSR
jgi:phosphoenolpyruvate carboxykinase (ATP)